MNQLTHYEVNFTNSPERNKIFVSKARAIKYGKLVKKLFNNDFIVAVTTDNEKINEHIRELFA